jgi:Lon protease-like protein
MRGKAVAQSYIRTDELPQLIPVFPLDAAVLLPRGRLPLNIFEPRYLNMIDDVMAGDRIIGMVQTTGADRVHPPLARVGCAGRVTSFAETQDGRYLITLSGVCRFTLGPELSAPTPYRQVRADYDLFAGDLQPPEEITFEREPLLQSLKAYLQRRGMDIEWDAARDAPADALITSLCMALPFEVAEKQALVEARTLADRMEALCALLLIDEAGRRDEDDDRSPRPLQ